MATITGTDGNDDIIGTADADTISAGLGNDTISGGGGDDSVEGGDGDDVLHMFYATDGNDTLVGGLGNDQIWARIEGQIGSQYAQVDGGEGDDTINAAAGGPVAEDAVTATGGAGQDTYTINGSSGLTITDFAAGVGGDHIDLSDLLMYSAREGLGYVGGNPFAAGNEFLRLFQSGADTLLQYDEDGGAGSSYGWHTVATLRNVDMSLLTAENFLGVAPDGSPVAGQVITGTALADQLWGGFFNDTISGGEGNDTLAGNGGDDWIEGGDEDAGGDLLLGGAGNDTLLGGAGNDTLDGSNGSDLVDGGPGNDSLQQGDDGNDTLLGGDGNDNFLLLSTGDQTQNNGENGPRALEVHGGDGDDDFWVGEVVGGSGSVLASGGAGQDTYRLFYRDPSRGLTITDFQAGVGGDRIDLDILLDYTKRLGPGFEGGNPFAAEQGYVRLVQEGAHTLLQFDPDGAAGAAHDWHTAAVLRDVTASTLTGDNFFGIPPDGSPIAGVNLTGTEYADQLQGWLGNDTLRGGFGNDSLEGAAGADLMEGGEGDDWMRGAEGGDTLLGGAGDDGLDGEYGDDYLHGGAGDDVLWCVGQTDDTLVGGAGADQFFLSLYNITQRPSVRVRGGSGDDFFHVVIDTDSSVLATGGTGRDTYSVYQGALSGTMSKGLTVTDFATGAGGDLLHLSSLVERGATIGGFTGGNPFDPSWGYLRFVERGTDTLLQFDDDGAAGAAYGWHTVMRLKDVAPSEIALDNFAPITRTGTDESELLLGGLNRDTLSGAGGSDTLDGGLSADWMAGGSGHDTYYVRETDDVVVELALGGVDIVLSSVDWNLGAHLENLTLEAGATRGTGNALANWIAGNDAANVLNGGRGSDTLAGGDGDDRYRVATPGDKVIESAGGGIDLVLSTSHMYSLPISVENGRIAIGGSASLAGNRLANVLYAGTGDNVLYGGDGIDTVSYRYATAGVTIDLALFFEQATGGSGLDRLDSIENLEGSRFDDRIVGSAGANLLEGSAGADVLEGGLGRDVLVGGTGRDVFDFDKAIDSTVTASGRDTIADFSGGDRIDVSGIDADTSRAANQSFTFIGSEAFNATDATRQLRYEYATATGVGILYGSTDADSAAEFAIKLTGVPALEASDMIL